MGQCCCGAVSHCARLIWLYILHYNLLYSLITLFNIQTTLFNIQTYQSRGNRLWMYYLNSKHDRLSLLKKHTGFRWIRWLLVGFLKRIFEVQKCTIYEIFNSYSQQAFWFGTLMLIWLLAPMLETYGSTIVILIWKLMSVLAHNFYWWSFVNLERLQYYHLSLHFTHIKLNIIKRIITAKAK